MFGLSRKEKEAKQIAEVVAMLQNSFMEVLVEKAISKGKKIPEFCTLVLAVNFGFAYAACQRIGAGDEMIGAVLERVYAGSASKRNYLVLTDHTIGDSRFKMLINLAGTTALDVLNFGNPIRSMAGLASLFLADNEKHNADGSLNINY